MMDNIPNLRLEVLINYVLIKQKVCTPDHASGVNILPSFNIMFAFQLNKIQMW